jgi:hypothetical protein
MPFRVTSPSPLPPAHPHTTSDIVAPRARAVDGLSFRLTLRAPAMRWAAAVLVTLGGRCTVQARVEAGPVTPAPAAVVHQTRG